MRPKMAIIIIMMFIMFVITKMVKMIIIIIISPAGPFIDNIRWHNAPNLVDKKMGIIIIIMFIIIIVYFSSPNKKNGWMDAHQPGRPPCNFKTPW